MKAKAGRRSKDINRRLESLERGVIFELAILHFADGTTERINGSGNHLRRLLGYTCRPEEAPPEYAPELESIRRAVDFEEPGGSLTINLTWAVLNTPVSKPARTTEVVNVANA
jgi:hypothetical protein